MSQPPSGVVSVALVFVGGAVGAGLRHGIGLLAGPSPFVTLAVNLLGALLLGMLLGRLGARDDVTARRLGAMLGTGLLGAFTTYSTFAVAMADAPTPDDWAAAIVALPVGVLLAGLGLTLGERRA